LLVVCIFAKDLSNKTALLRLLGNRTVWVGAGVTVLFTLLCFLTPIGRFFGIIESQISYFLLAFVPAIAFLACYAVLSAREKGRAKMKKNRKIVNKM
jgi:peptidoglycan/LPS O-acetylase OafA/YrhL